jgi:superfamily II RNA helicase
MPPSIHPVDLIAALREKSLTPAIVFLTSRRACDEAMEAFDHAHTVLPPVRQEAIAAALERVIAQYPSIAEHPLIPTVQRIGVAAHHAGHLPSWKIAIEELMRQGCLDAVFATTTLAAGVDFPARTVVITQSSIRKARDFMDLTIGEVQQIAGRAGRRGKDYVGFAVVTPSPYIDLDVLTKGFTGNPEAIDSQFTISYPMVLNLLKAHPHEQIQAILAKSFAQFQLNQRANVLEGKLDVLHTQMEPFGPRVCTDWITQWHTFDQARRQKPHRHQIARHESPEVTARFHFMTPGRVVGLSKGRGIVLRQYRSKGQKSPMVTVLRAGGAVTESPAGIVTDVFDRLFECTEQQGYPWCTPNRSMNCLPADGTPTRLPLLPILVSKSPSRSPTPSCRAWDSPPTCSSRPACQKDYIVASRLRQEQQRHIKSIQALRTSLWHRFQERIEVLQQFGYLSPTSHLTDDGEWARLIRIDHSLLITELIRAEAFAGADPAVLTGVMASIAHDDDRPGAFPRVSTGLSSLLGQVRKLAESLSPYEDPPLLRADIAPSPTLGIHPSLTWIGLAADHHGGRRHLSPASPNTEFLAAPPCAPPIPAWQTRRPRRSLIRRGVLAELL